MIRSAQDVAAGQEEASGPPVEVAVSLPVYRTYTYCLALVQALQQAIGRRVLVPFGARRVTGYVLGPAREVPPGAVKQIGEQLDEFAMFPPDMVPFFRWIADYYLHPIGMVIRAALPAGINVAETATYLLEDDTLKKEGTCGLDSKARALVEALAKGPRTAKQLETILSDSGVRSRLGLLVERGLVTRRLKLSSARIRPAMEKVVCLAADQPVKRLSAARLKIISALTSAGGPMSLRRLKKIVPTAPALVRAMERDGQVKVSQRQVYRDPLGQAVEPDVAPRLTLEQQAAVDSISGAMGQGFRAFVLAGITGSGKTEVYLRLAAKALAVGKPVIVLVPEIGLVSQSERRFRARFGSRVALLHSGLSAGERLDQWLKLAAGKAMIAIGARSAVFAPVEKPGLIIVDEEHDSSYKQDSGLHYNGRDLAVVRAKQADAVVVLGSATPSVQTIYNVQAGKYRRIDLRQRIGGRGLPQIQVVDLVGYRNRDKLHRMLTPPLIKAIGDTLAGGQQVVLFVNRRGSAGTLVCRVCGQPVTCRHCDVSLTWHRGRNAYVCHYCGFSQADDSKCGHCGSSRIKRLGLGTEKVETAVRELFPGARVARMDRDTTGRKGALVRMLKDLRDGRIDILVGTQMVAKGHDYPNITLVGIVCADLSLNMPDFRAGERTFQLLAQVAGRAGRGDKPGKVILQTYNPGHFIISAACRQSFEEFYRQEIDQRRVLSYPPFVRMVQIRIYGRDRQRTAAVAKSMEKQAYAIRRAGSSFADVQVLGPLEAPIARIAGRYRWQMLLKGTGSDTLRNFATRLCFDENGLRACGGVGISIDVDPMDMM